MCFALDALYFMLRTFNSTLNVFYRLQLWFK